MDPKHILCVSYEKCKNKSEVTSTNFRQNCVAEVFIPNYLAVWRYNKIFVPVSELGY